MLVLHFYVFFISWVIILSTLSFKGFQPNKEVSTLPHPRESVVYFIIINTLILYYSSV